eukprot:3469263-Prymnesium_polylepis.1
MGTSTHRRHTCTAAHRRTAAPAPPRIDALPHLHRRRAGARGDAARRAARRGQGAAAELRAEATRRRCQPQVLLEEARLRTSSRLLHGLLRA